MTKETQTAQTQTANLLDEVCFGTEGARNVAAIRGDRDHYFNLCLRYRKALDIIVDELEYDLTNGANALIAAREALKP